MSDRDPLDIDALMAEVDASLTGKAAKPPARVPAKTSRTTAAKGSAHATSRGESSTDAVRTTTRGRLASAFRLALVTAAVVGGLVYVGGFFTVGFLQAIPFAIGAALGAVPATLVGRLSRS